jgi:phosphoribosylanthranilate isomerase
MRVKICGITRPDQGVAIARLGATALGFICVPASPRYVAPEQIRAVTEALLADDRGSRVERIGVFVNASLDEIQRTVAIAQLSGIQLHGTESPEFCQQLRQHLPQISLIKALRIKDAEAIAAIPPYFDCIDTLLLDAYHPHLWGGTGETLDWSMLQSFRPPLPWLLAGGLTPDNLQAALTSLQPSGIDLSSGVENAPGDKNLAKVEQIFRAIAAFQAAAAL